MRNLSPLLVALATLFTGLFSTQSSAQISFDTHASSCEAVRPANGHYLVHKHEGLENPSTRTTWISCPVTTESIPIASDHYFIALVYNFGSGPLKLTCIFRYVDLDTGFRTINRTKTISSGSADLLEWELSSRVIASPNVNCKLPQGAGIASILSVSGLGLF